ncbi:MAG: TolC family protein, partial [bacterium]
LDEEYYDVAAGLLLEVPLGNRGARAEHQRAMLTRGQLADVVENLEQLVQVDVRTAIIEVNRAADQVTATTATRKAQEEKARAETEKFRVGKSTSILVAAAQRDLVASQIAEIQAVVNLLKAFINLYRLDGSLLLRRGIVAPGRGPPDRRAVRP